MAKADGSQRRGSVRSCRMRHQAPPSPWYRHGIFEACQGARESARIEHDGYILSRLFLYCVAMRRRSADRACMSPLRAGIRVNALEAKCLLPTSRETVIIRRV